MIIPAEIIVAMLAHLRGVYPDEGCGLLGGLAGTVSRHYPAANVATDNKSNRYLLEPQLLLQAATELKEAGLELTVIYHSHPHSPAYPSPADLLTAYYPDSYYLLVSLTDLERPDIRAYKIVKPDLWGATGEINQQALKIV